MRRCVCDNTGNQLKIHTKNTITRQPNVESPDRIYRDYLVCIMSLLPSAAYCMSAYGLIVNLDFLPWRLKPYYPLKNIIVHGVIQVGAHG